MSACRPNAGVSSCLATASLKSAVRYLGIEVDDALSLSERVEL
jgi:hypothetical protein